MTKKTLRIALFCTTNHPLPVPKNIIHAPLVLTNQLAEELSKRGHKVSLFASSNSRVKTFKLVKCGLPITKLPFFQKIKEMNDDTKILRYITLYQQKVLAEIYWQAKNFDLIHLHLSDLEHIIPFAKYSPTPTVITLHDRITPFRKIIFQQAREIKNLYLIPISNIQRRHLHRANYLPTVYHGIDANQYPYKLKTGKYLITVGRLVPEKGIDVAVKIARKTNLPLKILGKKYERGPGQIYWQKKIKPYLNKKIQYLSMIPPYRLATYYQNAKALLFPIQWEEPFGLVMIEAMACGTPVIAFRKGSVPEVVKDGVTGFIVETEKEMISAVEKIDQIDRADCRAWVEKKFSLERMISNYEKVYYKILHLKS